MDARRILRTTGLAALALGAVAGLGVLIVRDQLSRHRRDLFSSHPLRRFAALGFLSRRGASVDSVQLLRDFIAWESRPLLRRRAIQILERMEERLLDASQEPSREVAG